MSNTGRTCKVHYTGTFNDGTKFDSSYDRGEPIEFVCGAGQMIPGFDQAVEGMNVGDIIDVHLRPEDAYGMPDPEAIIKAPLADMPGAENLEVGNQVYLANSMGHNRDLFEAASNADVFGSMGSWNDGPAAKAAAEGKLEEYNKLSDMLFNQIALAVMYAINQW